MENKTKIQEMIAKASSFELELVWIPRIMERQTYDERVRETTIDKNNVGLNGRDAPFVSSIYDRIQEGKHLTDNMMSAVKRILPKYWRQYESMMIRKEGS